FFQAEDGIRDRNVTGVQTCALPICGRRVGVADLSLEQAISIADLEQIARQRMDVGAFDYCAGGSEDEITLRENVEAFRRKKLLRSEERRVGKEGRGGWVRD